MYTVFLHVRLEFVHLVIFIFYINCLKACLGITFTHALAS